MPLTQVVLRFIGSPQNPYGDDGRGFIITAPLNDCGGIDFGKFDQFHDACTVVGFRSGRARAPLAYLVKEFGAWRAATLADSQTGDGPTLCRWPEQSLSIGQNVQIDEGGGAISTYRVAEHFDAGVDPLAIASARLAEADW